MDRGRACSQHQVSPEPCLRNPGATRTLGASLLGALPPDKYFPTSILF